MHARRSARPPIYMSENFPEHVSGEGASTPTNEIYAPPPLPIFCILSLQSFTIVTTGIYSDQPCIEIDNLTYSAGVT